MEGTSKTGAKEGVKMVANSVEEIATRGEEMVETLIRQGKLQGERFAEEMTHMNSGLFYVRRFRIAKV